MTRRSSLRPSLLVALAVLLAADALLTTLLHGQAGGPSIAAPPPGPPARRCRLRVRGGARTSVRGADPQPAWRVGSGPISRA